MKLSSVIPLLCVGFVAAESGIDGWLRYAALPRANRYHPRLASSIVALNSTKTSPVYVAGQELQKGIEGIFGKTCNVAHGHDGGHKAASSSIVVGTLDEYTSQYGSLQDTPKLETDGFWLSTKGSQVQILGQNERGALYGAFEYLSMLAQANFSQVAYASNPSAPIRWTNEWNNMDGSIERGYGGSSIFFADGGIVDDLTRAGEYARLLASIGVNGVVVNNVNANATLLTPANVAGLGRIADVFRPYGVQLGISLNFASPTAGVTGRQNLTTFDPLDPSVINWWTNVTDDIYATIPDFAGYLVKANSEGQPGPAEYNRTLAQGANLFAGTLQPYGGTLLFRAFVYNYQTLNESDWYADRANAANDFFQPLDGEFNDNVVVQIKYGPIDFQVREPASPLFANLRKTASAIEVQISPEYLGQNCHLVYVPPIWKTVLDFDMRVDGQQSLVRDIVTGSVFNKTLGGFAGVSNVGLNDTWLGSHLAMSNLYTFGRLAWDPAQDAEATLQDWTRLTFGLDQSVVDTITNMSLQSWPAYENYSGNLGIQTLTDILYTHFGPNPASQDNNSWGQWTRADRFSIGMDRTVSNGTRFAGQYPSEVAQMWEQIESTPDNLLLWFHHVNYTHVLKEGKSIIQHFYDAHYDGADVAQTFVSMWQSLKGMIDTERFDHQLLRQTFQAGHSITWRDAINNFYHNLSSIDDAAGRVGSHPWRIEAESMDLDGYVLYDVMPFETASNYTAIVTATNSTTGTASATIPYDNGTYDLAVVFYDLYGGQAQYHVYINDDLIGTFAGNNPYKLGHTPSIYLDGHSATRITFPGVNVAKGDRLKIIGSGDGDEPAPLDYVAFLPAGVVD